MLVLLEWRLLEAFDESLVSTVTVELEVDTVFGKDILQRLLETELERFSDFKTISKLRSKASIS